MADSGLAISTSSPNLQDTFSGSAYPYMRTLQSRFEVISAHVPSFSAYLTRENRNKYVKLVETKKYGYTKNHLVDECPQSYFLAYMMRRDSSFLGDFKRVVDLTVESGLFTKWLGDVMYNASIYTPAECHEGGCGERLGPRAFTVLDLQTSFFILAVGLGLGVAVFCGELWWS